MKIGLEFEGVIRSSKDGSITRWPRIDERVRNGIKRMMFVRREKVEPIDTYDCLAEVRTPSLSNPKPVELLSALFTEMENASKAFLANGYFIQWSEQEIPNELHQEIKTHVLVEAAARKNSKQTLVIGADGIGDWIADSENLYRGGGLHINVSPVPSIFSSALVMTVHQSLSKYKQQFNFKSHYRNNLLFRNRWFQDGPTAEYMSFGFNASAIQGWQEILNNYERRLDDDSDTTPEVIMPPHLGWAWILDHAINKWFREVKGYNLLLPRKKGFFG